jgi:quercetin dioxygenase-like cupin family protein
MEIRRFGVGHRRPDGPPGTARVTGQVIHSDGRGAISELAFGRRASIEPHSNPRPTWFLVIEGGGFVGVGDERARVAAGEAVLWPPGVAHAAWTELSEMRAIVVELAGADDEVARGLLEGRARELTPGGGTGTGPGASDAIERGDGTLVESPPSDYDSGEGEPV